MKKKENKIRKELQKLYDDVFDDGTNQMNKAVQDATVFGEGWIRINSDYSITHVPRKDLSK